MVKADVLAALDAARGKYISGQELAQQLGVSRTAIWKAVDALRADGIPVAAVTNRGYTLSPAADVLNAAAVTALLAPEIAKPCRSRSSTACPAPTRPCVPVPRMARPRGWC